MSASDSDFVLRSTLAQYVEAFPPREPFVARGPEMLAWRTANTRFRMSWEHSADIGHGLGRNEVMAEAGIDACSLDTAQFARDVLAGLGDNISLSDLDALVEAFQTAAADWRLERKQPLVPLHPSGE